MLTDRLKGATSDSASYRDEPDKSGDVTAPVLEPGDRGAQSSLAPASPRRALRC